MTLEVRIPISPTPSFLNRVVLIAASLRRFHPDAIVHAYIGQPGGPTAESVQRVATVFAEHRILQEWIEKDEFDFWADTRSPYLATMNRRFTAPMQGDAIIIADADIIFTGHLFELIERNKVQGVMAHVAPMAYQDLSRLYALCEAPWGALYSYSGNGIMGPLDAAAPWYANSGFVYAPAHLFEKLIKPYHECIWRLRLALRDTYWFDQLALALAVAKSEVPAMTLPLRYNFPNQGAFDVARSSEMSLTKVIHYLRTDTIDRDRDFVDVNAMYRFVLRGDLTGSNELLRQTVAKNMSILVPKVEMTAENAPYA